MNAPLTSRCAMCGGARKPGRTTYTVDRGSGIVVVRNVPATVCDQCGEEWIDNETAQRLERITEEAQQKREQVAILAM